MNKEKRPSLSRNVKKKVAENVEGRCGEGDENDWGNETKETGWRLGEASYIKVVKKRKCVWVSVGREGDFWWVVKEWMGGSAKVDRNMHDGHALQRHRDA
jgi:hypothetical protein